MFTRGFDDFNGFYGWTMMNFSESIWEYSKKSRHFNGFSISLWFTIKIPLNPIKIPLNHHFPMGFPLVFHFPMVYQRMISKKSHEKRQVSARPVAPPLAPRVAAPPSAPAAVAYGYGGPRQGCPGLEVMGKSWRCSYDIIIYNSYYDTIIGIVINNILIIVIIYCYHYGNNSYYYCDYYCYYIYIHTYMHTWNPNDNCFQGFDP